MMESLMRYLRAALPRVRAASSTLGGEIDLARAYLELFAVRMRDRLRFEFDLDPAIESVPFPPMLILTLVENAVKHGIGPAAQGGKIEIKARRSDAGIQVEVSDDGVGFGSVPTGGTGVGLANIRRQLSARYGARATFSLAENAGRGVLATITVPHLGAPIADRSGATGTAATQS